MGLWQVAGGIYMTAWNNVTRLTQNKASYLMLWKRQTRLYKHNFGIVLVS